MVYTEPQYTLKLSPGGRGRYAGTTRTTIASFDLNVIHVILTRRVEAMGETVLAPDEIVRSR